MSSTSNQHNKNSLSVIYSSAKTDTIHEIMKKADGQSLVIWDVDGVLLIGKDKIFHSENIHSGLNQEYVEYIKNKFHLTAEQSNKFLSQLLLQRPIQLVDKALLSIMHELKSRYIKSIALTQFATGALGDIKSVADWRIDELNQLGIKFDFAFTDLIQVKLDTLTTLKGNPPLYKHGVIFCERYSKGEVLGAFLDIISWKPNSVIFIDDKLECLEMVQGELKIRNIDFIGLHYVAALDFPYEVDDKVVKFQYDYAMQNGRWLNDQAAITAVGF
ncbi:MAG TPA: DUF2608 domain-containing protein [Gammaproteobacteria bacterium]|nr:DUF2608 domain-containing protein [Gammaproteobacteria bacterium]